MDKATRNAWIGFPYVDIVDNSDVIKFDDKILKLISVVCDRIGLDYQDRLAKNSRYVFVGIHSCSNHLANASGLSWPSTLHVSRNTRNSKLLTTICVPTSQTLKSGSENAHKTTDPHTQLRIVNSATRVRWRHGCRLHRENT